MPEKENGHRLPPDDNEKEYESFAQSEELPMVGRKGKVKLNLNALVTIGLLVAIAVVTISIVQTITQTITNRRSAPPPPTTPVPSAEVTATPEPGLRPESTAQGYLPVFYRAYTDEYRIAVTVTGEMKESRLSKLIATANEMGAKLTFFPKGKDVEKNVEMWQEISLMGHEIESFGYSGEQYLRMSTEQKADDLDKAIGTLRDYIHKDYALHFLRTNDAYDYEYLELHRLLAARGVYGIASQSAQLISAEWQDIQPGIIINIDLNSSSDMNELCRRLQLLGENGYQLVTMNELFAYGPNYASTPEIE